MDAQIKRVVDICVKFAQYVHKTSTYCARYVRGKKTYIAIYAAGSVEVLYAFGQITLEQRDALLKVFGSGAALAFAAKVNRAVESLKAVRNTMERGQK